MGNLFVWDLVCNVIATLGHSDYTAICEMSCLNPDNYVRTFNKYISTCAAAAAKCSTEDMPVVIGMQEWPSAESPKEAILRRMLNQRGYDVATSFDSCALAYRKDLGPPVVLTKPRPDGSPPVID